MFRAIFNKGIKPLNVLASEFCTNAPRVRRFREINSVELVGTLISDSFVLQSGTRALTLKTSNSPIKYTNHNVTVKSTGDYVAGQRVCIEGKLSTNNVETSEGKSVTVASVKATQLFVMDNETPSTDEDVNRVKILGNVSNDPLNKDKDSSFSIATHFNVSNETGDAETKVNFHRVFAYDEPIRKYIQENIGKSDRVLVTGRLEHMTYTGTNGKKVFSGFIVAQNILKVGKRSKVDASSNESIAEN